MRLACIDLGSSAIAVAIAASGPGVRPRLLGRGWAPAAGIERGDVVDLEAAGRALAAALEAAERAAGGHAGQAVLALGGTGLRAVGRRGQMTLGRDPVRVTRKQAARAVESVTGAGAEPGQELLHVLPRSFWLDGRRPVRNPLGMAAMRLEVETLVVSGESAAVRNALRCAQNQGLDVREVVVAPLAAADGALTAQEREAGVILLDLGAASTGAVVFAQGAPAVIVTLPHGGRHVTSDVAMVLRVSLRQAERLKLSFGRATADDIPDRLLDVPDDEAIGVDPVSHRLLCEVMAARLEEIFEQVMRAIAATGFAEPLPAGLVLTGGGAALPEIEVLARRMFALPARVASVNLPGAPAAALSPAWGTVAGLLHRLERGQADLLPESREATRGGFHVGRLVRQFLPLGGD